MSKEQTISRFREMAPDRRDEFVASGYRSSLFYPHRTRYLPKFGPDGFKLARRMCGWVDPDSSWEVVLYATSPLVEEFPQDLFFDDDVVWHQQQFGRAGQIATANLAVGGRTLYSMVHISDVVQRIGRRRELKTRVENRFRGWPHMLLNAVMSFAIEGGMSTVRTPTSELALGHTDPSRSPGREMFERIYDRSVHEIFNATRDDDWWVLDVEANRGRVVLGEPACESSDGDERTICLNHDIERGLGHRDVAPEFAAGADLISPSNLERMLEVEEEAGVVATYCVVGAFLNEERAKIAKGGHALAFHSYDHSDDGADQLARCRSVDYRLKGYRVPRSLPVSTEQADDLLFHNFEWLASSRWSFGFSEPKIERRLVRIPIAFDDFAMYSEGMSYDAWERHALEEISRSRRFIAFSLHDCYASYWLPHYRRLLEQLKELGTLRTLDEAAAEVVLRNAC